MNAGPMTLYTEAQRREAADWFVLINEQDDPETDTLQAWLQWMDAHEGNRQAFEAVAQVWQSMPRMPAVAMIKHEEVLADDYDPDQSVAAWNSAHDSTEAVVAPPKRWQAPAFTGRRRWLAAASLAVVFLLGGDLMWHLRGHSAPNGEFTTRTSEQIQITLTDGSQVWLGPRSRLLVSFTAAKRNLQLITGEAFFSVKKDKSRPFVVHSAGGDITAVGTAFNVRNVDRQVLLTVSEGVVTVAPSQPTDGTPAPTVRVASGQQVTFNSHTELASLDIQRSAAPGERARWRDGILVYRDEPLISVIRDLSRYRSLPLDIPEASVGELRYSGVVYTDALDEWLAALPESFPVRVISHDDREEIRSR